ncbi:TolB family protein [Micromonospora costi]|uniref:WD40 repeat domain-containing protein n=1 Tax=Micromonospora costi TaxID=1530042 RepID=A0A3A9ZU25_9ACTN|nr:PD40 domain-containing protein [Micromonospora costi]RKN51444.1 hypothetical protein D7193_29210 [Micromonospora costi]
MSRDLEDAVRTAVRDLAGEARLPLDLAGEASRRGRRLRRRRRAAASAGAFAAVLVLAVPYLWLRPDPPAGDGAAWQPAPEASATATTPGTPEATPVPSTGPTPGKDWIRRPLTLPGGWVLTGAGSTGAPATTGWALDRDAGRYVAVDRYEVLLAPPRGDVAAVVDYERTGEIGLLDLRTKAVHWVPTGPHIMTPQWSPDGRRLALTLMDKATGGLALGVLTVGGGYRTYPVDTKRYLCTDRCSFTWSRDGRNVVLQQTDPDAPRSESAPHVRRGVQLFSPDDGRATRFVPVPGDPAGPWSWSPDGRLVVIKGPDGPRIAEAATGRIVATAPGEDAAWVTGDRLLYRDVPANALVLVDVDGRELARQPLPPALDNLTLVIAPE